MVPDLDSQIGISVYSTDFEGIGGTIRNSPEDFQVSEIISEKTRNSIKPDGDYAVYKLTKKKIDTNHALSDIFRKKGLRVKSLGLKDASAVTEQFVCARNKERATKDYTSERYSLSHIGFVKKPLSKKDMIGNHFRITICGCRKEDLSTFTEHEKILNFYGYQRFGSKRPVTHLVGKALLQKNFEKAVELILSFTSPYDSKENTEMRQRLADKANFSECLGQLPYQMDVERIVLKEMIAHDDYLKAVRSIPLHLRRFYVQAYQSYLFNRSLSSAFEAGESLFEAESGDVCFDLDGIIKKFAKGQNQNLALPSVGYSYYKKTRFNSYISEILKLEEISPKDFFIKEMQEISGQGGFRQASICCRDYSSENDSVQFTLSRGSFATVLLREIIKPADPMAAGF